MKIVNCALLYADGDKYVWSVVTEDASKFPIDMDLVADGSIWENDGVKSVLTDGAWVAESSGGGGTAIPEITLTPTGDTDGTYTSTISFTEMMGLITTSPWSDAGHKVYPLWTAISNGQGDPLVDFKTARIASTVTEGIIDFKLDETRIAHLKENGTVKIETIS